MSKLTVRAVLELIRREVRDTRYESYMNRYAPQTDPWFCRDPIFATAYAGCDLGWRFR